MPLMMRRVVLRTGVAASATLASALLARKWWDMSDAGESRAATPKAAGDEGVAPSGGLRDVAASLERLMPPTPLARFPVRVAGPSGVTADVPVRSLFGAHGTVLNLWATWCGPCRREMPSLARLAAVVRADGIAVVPLSVDRGGIDAVRAFYRRNGVVGLPLVADGDEAAERALGLGAIPVTLLLDRSGAVVARLDGGADWGTSAAVRAVRALVGPGGDRSGG